ncbi:hypothetical protein HNO89_004012 [Sporosarcina luteola]|nr:hypothetical protein [Sporosarcina luteola]
MKQEESDELRPTPSVFINAIGKIGENLRIRWRTAKND